MEAGSAHNKLRLHQEAAMQYKVELIKSEEGYAVGCPELPGCWSQGDTEEEALHNIKDAISEYLLAKQEIDERKEIRYVEVLAS
jgi:predicted RNase H-like HicB family nuclease